MKKFLNSFLASDNNAQSFSSNSGRFLDLFAPRGSVTSSNAQKIADVFSCVNIKANAIAIMPLKLYLKRLVSLKLFIQIMRGLGL